MENKLNGIRIRELEIFSAVAKAKSIREASRRLKISPGEVSKSIRNLERKLSLNLLKRSASGVVLSEYGTQSYKLMEEVLDHLTKIQSLSLKKATQYKKNYTIASTSFLITHLIAENISDTYQHDREISFRFIDLAPDLMVSSGLRSAFEIAFHFGSLDWPKTWDSQRLGSVEWVLCAKKKHPLQNKSSISNILKYPFIQPSYWTLEGLSYGTDHFPTQFKRIKGYETATADAAIPILLNTDQLAFLPYPLIKNQLKELKILTTKEIKPVKKDLYLSVRSDLIPLTMQKKILQNFTNALTQLDIRTGLLDC